LHGITAAITHGSTQTGTIVFSIGLVLTVAIAIGAYYRWRGPTAHEKTPADLARFRRATIGAVLLAAVIVVRLATQTYR
jgi:hypothetical protein